MIYTGIFSLAVGLVMIGQWSFLYLLISSGIALLSGLQWAITSYLISLGMLFYTLIVSPGYFAQQGEWKWVGIFAVLMIAGLISLAPLL